MLTGTAVAARNANPTSRSNTTTSSPGPSAAVDTVGNLTSRQDNPSTHVGLGWRVSAPLESLSRIREGASPWRPVSCVTSSWLDDSRGFTYNPRSGLRLEDQLREYLDDRGPDSSGLNARTAGDALRRCGDRAAHPGWRSCAERGAHQLAVPGNSSTRASPAPDARDCGPRPLRAPGGSDGHPVVSGDLERGRFHRRRR